MTDKRNVISSVVELDSIGISLSQLSIQDDNENELEPDESSITPLDPSIPPPDGTCHLFRLPRELLDEIYTYVLTEEDSLYPVPARKGYCHRSKKLFASPNGPREFNQLKYVCFKTWRETRGVGLKWNTITFDHTQFHRFVRNCSPRNQRWLRVTVLDAPNDVWRDAEYWDEVTSETIEDAWVERLHELIDFCDAHPKARVIYRTNVISGKDHPMILLLLGTALVLAIRDINLQPDLLPHVEMEGAVKRLSEHFRNGRDASVMDVPNLRILPLESGFDHEGFRLALGEGDDGLRTNAWNTISAVEGGYYAVLDMVCEWYKRGI
ncbi:hypothetical protein CC78DRAFT_537040 [Lojkania enalia]|uniref:F-box domain-containing protein n=1 Tax=Lojkania enalia TaxID=147567 RepID=A0A9P4K4U6_9PLEO|nr:hypothetical protein CC78DRAFT_537040 [Didymosphaeria enalia]